MYQVQVIHKEKAPSGFLTQDTPPIYFAFKHVVEKLQKEMAPKRETEKQTLFTSIEAIGIGVS